MEEQIAHFSEQFSWEPEVLNADRLPQHHAHTIVCGMGGSHLGARLLLRHDPTLALSIHSDYGLPPTPADRLQSALVVASSYSGETEETLDAARAATDAGLAVAVMTTGGTLADFAREHSLPLILMPKANVEPRMAVGTAMLSIARFMRNETLERDIRDTGLRLEVQKDRMAGEALAQSLVGSIPVIYASTLNSPLAYFWKIALNETGKIPAFYNLFPEVCHNELSGFDTAEETCQLSSRFHVVMVRDDDDHPRIAKRMRIMRDLLETRGIAVTSVELVGDSGLAKALSGILHGVWTALALAKKYGVPDAATPLIAEFKRKVLES